MYKWLFFLPTLLFASHLLYTQTDVVLNKTTNSLPALETIRFTQPQILLPNRKYAITFLYNTSISVSRTYMGAHAVNPTQCGLFLKQSNMSVVYPASLSYAGLTDIDMYFDPIAGQATMNFTAATTGVNLDTSTGDAGWGQTFNSASGGNLSSFLLYLAPSQGSATVLTATMRLYDLSSYGSTENPTFTYEQEIAPTTQSQAPTTAPTSQASTSKTPTKAPTPQGFFVPDGCDSTYIPNQYQNTTTVFCNQTNTTVIIPNKTIDTVLSDVITITIYDKNGTELSIQNLPADKQISFFLPFTSNGSNYLNAITDNPCDPQPDVTCAWLNDNEWNTSGCHLAPELGQRNPSGVPGRYCTCNHLTSFSLLLRYRTDPTALCRSTSQYVWAAVFGVIAVLSVIQMIRLIYVAHRCGTIVMTHLAVAVAALINMTISLIIPLLATEPALLVFLSSIVTLVELCCYIYLVYVWVGVSGSQLGALDTKLKYPFAVFLVVTTGVVIGFPIGIWLTNSQDTQLALARTGSYVMSAITAALCISLTVSGLRLRAQLVGPQRSSSNRCSIRNRILIGSVGLSVSVLAQALLWSISVDASVLNNPSAGDAIEHGFNIAAVLTFLTLLFMFFFGVNDAVTAAQKKNSQKSKRGDTLADSSLRSTERSQISLGETSSMT